MFLEHVGRLKFLDHVCGNFGDVFGTFWKIFGRVFGIVWQGFRKVFRG